MWALVSRWLGFPQTAATPVRVKVNRAALQQDWNGTILSGESYR